MIWYGPGFLSALVAMTAWPASLILASPRTMGSGPVVRNATDPVKGSTMPALTSTPMPASFTVTVKGKSCPTSALVATDETVVTVGTLGGREPPLTVTGPAELADTLELLGVYCASTR